MSCLDLKHAYLSVLIATEHRKYLRFKWKGHALLLQTSREAGREFLHSAGGSLVETFQANSIGGHGTSVFKRREIDRHVCC